MSSASFYNAINTKFELFYQNLLTNISHIQNNKHFLLKIKIRNTCHKYKKIKVPYKHKQVIRKLSKYENIGILRQDKEGGRGSDHGQFKIYAKFFRYIRQ